MIDRNVNVLIDRHIYRHKKCSIEPDRIGRGSERRKSLHRKSKKEHRKSKTSLLDQSVESIY